MWKFINYFCVNCVITLRYTRHNYYFIYKISYLTFGVKNWKIEKFPYYRLFIKKVIEWSRINLSILQIGIYNITKCKITLYII